MASTVAAARGGEIVLVGSAFDEGAYYVVPRVCVSSHRHGQPWLPVAALSPAGRATLARLNATAALPPVMEMGLPDLQAVNVGPQWKCLRAWVRVHGGLALAVRTGTEREISAADGARVPVMGSRHEAPAVLMATFRCDHLTHFFDSTVLSAFGSYLRLGSVPSSALLLLDTVNSELRHTN